MLFCIYSFQAMLSLPCLHLISKFSLYSGLIGRFHQPCCAQLINMYSHLQLIKTNSNHPRRQLSETLGALATLSLVVSSLFLRPCTLSRSEIFLVLYLRAGLRSVDLFGKCLIKHEYLQAEFKIIYFSLKRCNYHFYSQLISCDQTENYTFVNYCNCFYGSLHKSASSEQKPGSVNGIKEL